jgi:hypothetical protein
MTTQLLREFLDSLKDDIETLGMEEVMPKAKRCLSRWNVLPSNAWRGCFNPALMHCSVRFKPWKTGNSSQNRKERGG